jgi:hypothetical protein
LKNKNQFECVIPSKKVAWFGYSVAMDNNIAVIGALGVVANPANAVYVVASSNPSSLSSAWQLDGCGCYWRLY